MKRLAMKRLAPACLLGVGLLLASGVTAQKVDAEVERLRSQLRTLERDSLLGELARVERLRAQQAIDALAGASRRDRRPAPIGSPGFPGSPRADPNSAAPAAHQDDKCNDPCTDIRG